MSKKFNRVVWKTGLTAFFAFAVGVLFSPNIYAKNLVVVLSHYPPWVITDPEPYSGIDVDIINYMAKELSLNVTYKKCPWKRCLKMMETGHADLMTGLFKTPEREEYMMFLSPAYFPDPPKVFYLNKKANVQINSYDDLKSLKIGVVNGTKYFDKFDDDAKIEKQGVNSELQLLKLLKIQRVDAFISTESQADYLIATNGYSDEFRKAKYHYGDGSVSYIALSKKSGFVAQQEKFNRLIAKAVEQGTFKKIAEDFYKKTAKSLKK